MSQTIENLRKELTNKPTLNFIVGDNTRRCRVFYVTGDNRISELSGQIARALNLKWNDKTAELTIPNCGYHVSTYICESLGKALFQDSGAFNRYIL